ncbi:MAG: elongation factor P [Tenericutes bacterium]|nr:MAG: elongation factor P [Mycoplasmatota bacterium]
MINVNEFKSGTTFLRDGEVYMVIESSHSKSGRGQAHVKAKIKNLLTGSTTIATYTGGDKVEKAFVQLKEMQYLYNDGANSSFMDNTTFEQIDIPNEGIVEQLKFLKEGADCKVKMYEQLIIGVELSRNVQLKVVETTDAVKGDTVTAASKKATLETGIELDVPQFIKIDEEILVSTDDGKYVGRA